MTTTISRRSFLQFSASASALLSFDALAASGPRGNGARIIVLGAGMAGLSAALRLKELGYDVTVLEARTRPGGRVHTIREPFSDGLYAEAGAGRIPSTHALTLEYVKRFRLTLDPFYPKQGSGVFLWRGKRQVVPFGADPKLDELDIDLTARERAAGIGGLSALYFDTVREEVRAFPAGGWPFPTIDRYKDISFGAYLKSKGASNDAVKILSSGFEDDSLLDMSHDATSHAVPMLWKIRGGNDLLPAAMARALSDEIRYGAEVRRIEQDDAGVRVSFVAGGTTHTIVADRLICTLPFTVLRDIEIGGALSEGKRRAIRELYMGAVARVLVQTRSRFWETQQLTGFATIDQPMEIWSPTFNQPGKRGIVMSYIYEDLAVEYSRLSPDAQIERTLALYEQIHPGLRDQVETATTWSWVNEKYSRGAYMVTKPDQFPLLAHVATSEGRLHFAGEHTSPWPGWIQGALHSGLRAVKEIQVALTP